MNSQEPSPSDRDETADSGESQATLVTFSESEEPEQPDTPPADSRTTRKRIIPEGFDWGVEKRSAYNENVGDAIETIAPLLKKEVHKIGDEPVWGSEVSIITSGAEEYRNRFATGDPVDIPDYYSSFDDFDPILTGYSVAAHGGGFGITATRLETAIRILTGGGTFQADSLRVTPCGGHPLLVEDLETDSDTGLLLTPAHIDRNAPIRRAFNPNKYKPKLTGVGEDTSPAPFGILEDDPRMRTGLDRLYTTLQVGFDIKLVRHLNHDPHNQLHSFETSDGQQYDVRYPTLRALSEGKTTPEGIEGGHETPINADTTVIAICEDPKYSPGDSLVRPRSAVATFDIGTSEQDTKSITHRDDPPEMLAVYRALYLKKAPEEADAIEVGVIKDAHPVDAMTVPR